MSKRPDESDDYDVALLRKLRANYDAMLAQVREQEKVTYELVDAFVREGSGDATVLVVTQLALVTSQLSALASAVYQGIDLMLAAEQRRSGAAPGWDLPKPSAD